MNARKLESLLKNLQHGDPSRRRAAAEALADSDIRAVLPLIKALGDDNCGVQDAAIHSLMAIRNESTAYMILPLLRENAFLRNTAILILKEMGEIAVPLLGRQLKDRDDDVRKFSLDLITDIRNCGYEDDIIEVLENDCNANVRAAAAKALGRLNCKRALNSLLRALHDDEWVVFSALEALSELNLEESAPAIASLLKSPSETIRFAAVETLGNIRSDKSIESLLSYFRESKAAARTAALQSLIKQDVIPEDSGVEKALISMLDDTDWDTRSIAIKGLSSMKALNSIRTMIDIAGSYDPSMPDNEDRILFIMKAIENIGCEDALIALLNDTTIKYRGKSIAIECMGNLRCRKAVPELIKLLQSDLRDIRRSSIKSLGMIDKIESRELLRNAIMDPDSHVRKSAIISLGIIGDKQAFELMIRMLSIEKYRDITDDLITSLFRIDTEELFNRKDNCDNYVRERIESIGAGFTEGAAC